MEKRQRKFDIKIVFGDFGLESVQSIPDLTEEQTYTLTTIPPYYYNLELSGYIEENKFIVENIITDNHGEILPVTYKEFDELLYESPKCNSWLINNIEK